MSISEQLATYGIEHERFEDDLGNGRHIVGFRGAPMGLINAHEAVILLELLRATHAAALLKDPAVANAFRYLEDTAPDEIVDPLRPVIAMRRGADRSDSKSIVNP